MNVIILGDKFQKRMKSRGCVGLLKDKKNTTILDHQYNTIIKNFPNANIIYVYGFEAKKFETYIDENRTKYKSLHIIKNDYYDTYNSAFSLFLAQDFLSSNCLLVFGDTTFSSNFFYKFNIEDNESSVFLSYNQNYKLGCTIGENNYLTNINYDLNNYIYNNTYYLIKKDSLLLNKYLNNRNNYNCFLFELINQLIEYNCCIKPLFIDTKKKT